MSNLEAGTRPKSPAVQRFAGALPMVQVLHPREVPLGGPRAIRVQRTLPQRQRSLIGAWCFIDHYGPVHARMDVPPHPHTGLQTVSWLFSGGVEHRDSAGVHALVRPGELNLMTAGAGICHSEVSIKSDAVLHGVQLWVALPDSDRDTARDFAHYAPKPISLPGAVARVFLGELAGSRSPVPHVHPAARRPDRSGAERWARHRRRPGVRTRRALRFGSRRDGRDHPGGRRSRIPRPGQLDAAACATSVTDPRGCCCSAGPRSPKSW